MQEKTAEIKGKVKEFWRKYEYDILVTGGIVVAMWIGKEIGFSQGYIKCLSDVVQASSGSAN